MTKPNERLKSPAVAAVLSAVVPGLGHLFQGRHFKGLLYLICIWGTFFFGSKLGDWKVVNLDWRPEQRTWPYVCQFWAGAVAWPGIYQNTRVRSNPELVEATLLQPVETAFTGQFIGGGEVKGTIKLTPDRQEAGTWVTGEFNGTLTIDKETTPLKGQVRNVTIEPQVAPDQKRYLKCDFEGTTEKPAGPRRAEIQGWIPRSVADWYCAPLQDRISGDRGMALPELRSDRPYHPHLMLELAHRELGARFELGVLYTMVAGLLNILCIFDALEGPAYETDEKKDDENAPPAPPPST